MNRLQVIRYVSLCDVEANVWVRKLLTKANELYSHQYVYFRKNDLGKAMSVFIITFSISVFYNKGLAFGNPRWLCAIKKVGWLFGFYGISTFVGYFTPNPFFCK